MRLDRAMPPHGGKCPRVSKVATKGRRVSASHHQQQQQQHQEQHVSPDRETEETITAMATMTTVTSSGTAVATTRMDKPAATAAATAAAAAAAVVTTACNDEGRSQWTGRMRQSLESSSSEPARENGGTPVHRYPERQRRGLREKHAAGAGAGGRKHRPAATAAKANSAVASCSSSTSLSSPPPVLSSPSSSSCASSRRSSSPSPSSSTWSPTRSSTSSVTSDHLVAIKPTAAAVAVSEGPRRSQTPPDHHSDDGIGKRRQNAAGTRRGRDNDGSTTHETTTDTTTTATTATTTSLVTSSSPFPSPASTSSASCRTTTTTTTTTTTPPRGHGAADRGTAHVSSSSALERLRNALENYDRSRIYLAHVCYLDWRDLPGKRRGGGDATRSSERVWVVGAADHEGHHRTRLLVAGRHWRPRCLRRVNMLSQPVVYAGGGRGSLTADLFLWWFHREFAVTAMAMHPDGAVLVAESADYLPPENDCVAADGLVRLFVVPKDCMETRLVVRELRVRLATGILSRARCGVYRDKFPSILGLPEEEGDRRLDVYLKRFTLKEAFADLHRAWLSVRSETFARSWTLPRDREDHPLTGCNGAMLPPRIHAVDHEEDRMLFVQLQNLARQVGLEISDDELGSWILDEESTLAGLIRKREAPDEEHSRIKIEVEPDRWSDRNGDEDDDGGNDGVEEDDGEDEPTAEEAVGLLSRVLTWMEREPLDPGLLLAVRSMRDTAALMASKMGLAGTHPSGLPFFCPNGDHLTQPPPAHMGIPPYGALDAGKAAAAAGLTRAPMYPFSTGQYAYPMLSPEMTQVASWHTPSMYPISPANAGFRSPYPTSLPITSSSLPSDLYRFSPTGLMPPHPGLSPHAHALASHALVSSAPKADHSTLDHNHRSTIEQKNSTSLPTDNAKAQDTGQQNNQDKKKPHIKKPLNAFMLYMKEMRAKVVAECTLKESAAINQILGRRWHALGREEQAKYYELARRERQLHMQLYPDWSSRANTNRTKKRKRKQDTNSDPGGNNMKKCRARYGLDQQSQWCKPCRRKKKCVRYMGEGGDGDGEADGEAEDDHSEDNLGSVGEAGTPEEDESLSSPGGLSALSSLASPSLVLPSPSSLASPCPCPLTPPVPPPSLSNTNQPPMATTTTTTTTTVAAAAAAAAAAAMAMAGSAVTSAATQQQQQQQPQPPPQPHRNPVGTNPHDINNPLSVNQLTGQCIKSEPAPSGPSNPAISVT
ncbi:uncharacterized protein LOC105837174 isoform X2 [Monomorium pharaonis]|uniref:uncharacterized protein LOC105837174 isoform X2 n=1 Tax=Monomorium pharaonis TaxID=307658 RepID=UPI001747305A|nr:uncharacterized protein LOC105837174 isoform X2 [Monomorium pharaonis]